MKQLLIQIDDQTAERIEQIAPGRHRKRSEFLRAVIARAVAEELEKRTRAAYLRWPDEPGAFDAAEWAADEEAMHPHEPPRPAAVRRAQDHPRRPARARTRRNRGGAR
jgi:predicted transcriptional regulator